MSLGFKKRVKLTVLAIAICGAMTVSPVQADTVTFASFEETGGNSFKYDTVGVAGSGGVSNFVTNTTPLSGGNVVPTSIPINFRYVPSTVFTTGLNPLLIGNQAAHMTLNVTSTSAVVPFGGFLVQQSMIGFVEIRRDTAIAGQSLLLRVDFNGNYFGFSNGNTSTLGADSSLGDSISFSSDFINFSGTTEENMSLTFTSVTPVLVRSLISLFYRSHNAHGTGSFAAATAVPEPGTLIGAFAGLAFAGLAVVRRRTQKA